MSATNRGTERKPHFSGIGYLKNNKKKDNPRAYNIWRGMIRRCYDNKSQYYYTYGELGVKVDEEWHCFDNFLRDIKLIDGYDDDLFHNAKITLDKDKKQINKNKSERIYSKETCCWLTYEEQWKYTDFSYRYNEFYAVKDGMVYLANCHKDFAERFDIYPQNIRACLNKRRKQTGGFTFYKKEEIEFENVIDIRTRIGGISNECN